MFFVCWLINHFICWMMKTSDSICVWASVCVMTYKISFNYIYCWLISTFSLSLFFSLYYSVWPVLLKESWPPHFCGFPLILDGGAHTYFDCIRSLMRSVKMKTPRMCIQFIDLSFCWILLAKVYSNTGFTHHHRVFNSHEKWMIFRYFFGSCRSCRVRRCFFLVFFLCGFFFESVTAYNPLKCRFVFFYCFPPPRPAVSMHQCWLLHLLIILALLCYFPFR